MTAAPSGSGAHPSRPPVLETGPGMLELGELFVQRVSPGLRVHGQGICPVPPPAWCRRSLDGWRPPGCDRPGGKPVLQVRCLGRVDLCLRDRTYIGCGGVQRVQHVVSYLERQGGLWFSRL